MSQEIFGDETTLIIAKRRQNNNKSTNPALKVKLKTGLKGTMQKARAQAGKKIKSSATSRSSGPKMPMTKDPVDEAPVDGGCCVEGCFINDLARNPDGEKFKSFKIPGNPGGPRREKWIKILRPHNRKWNPGKGTKVCERHFDVGENPTKDGIPTLFLTKEQNIKAMKVCDVAYVKADTAFANILQESSDDDSSDDEVENALKEPNKAITRTTKPSESTVANDKPIPLGRTNKILTPTVPKTTAAAPEKKSLTKAKSPARLTDKKTTKIPTPLVTKPTDPKPSVSRGPPHPTEKTTGKVTKRSTAKKSRKSTEDISTETSIFERMTAKDRKAQEKRNKEKSDLVREKLGKGPSPKVIIRYEDMIKVEPVDGGTQHRVVKQEAPIIDNSLLTTLNQSFATPIQPLPNQADQFWSGNQPMDTSAGRIGRPSGRGEPGMFADPVPRGVHHVPSGEWGVGMSRGNELMEERSGSSGEFSYSSNNQSFPHPQQLPPQQQPYISNSQGFFQPQPQIQSQAQNMIPTFFDPVTRRIWAPLDAILNQQQQFYASQSHYRVATPSAFPTQPHNYPYPPPSMDNPPVLPNFNHMPHVEPQGGLLPASAPWYPGTQQVQQQKQQQQHQQQQQQHQQQQQQLQQQQQQQQQSSPLPHPQRMPPTALPPLPQQTKPPPRKRPSRKRKGKAELVDLDNELAPTNCAVPVTATPASSGAYQQHQPPSTGRVGGNIRPNEGFATPARATNPNTSAEFFCSMCLVLHKGNKKKVECFSENNIVEVNQHARGHANQMGKGIQDVFRICFPTFPHPTPTLKNPTPTERSAKTSSNVPEVAIAEEPTKRGNKSSTKRKNTPEIVIPDQASQSSKATLTEKELTKKEKREKRRRSESTHDKQPNKRQKTDNKDENQPESEKPDSSESSQPQEQNAGKKSSSPKRLNEKIAFLSQVLLSKKVSSLWCSWEKCHKYFPDSLRTPGIDLQMHVIHHFPGKLLECAICGHDLNLSLGHFEKAHKGIPPRFKDYRTDKEEELLDIFDKCFPKFDELLGIRKNRSSKTKANNKPSKNDDEVIVLDVDTKVIKPDKTAPPEKKSRKSAKKVAEQVSSAKKNLSKIEKQNTESKNLRAESGAQEAAPLPLSADQTRRSKAADIKNQMLKQELFEEIDTDSKSPSPNPVHVQKTAPIANRGSENKKKTTKGRSSADFVGQSLYKLKTELQEEHDKLEESLAKAQFPGTSTGVDFETNVQQFRDTVTPRELPENVTNAQNQDAIPSFSEDSNEVPVDTSIPASSDESCRRPSNQMREPEEEVIEYLIQSIQNEEEICNVMEELLQKVVGQSSETLDDSTTQIYQEELFEPFDEEFATPESNTVVDTLSVTEPCLENEIETYAAEDTEDFAEKSCLQDLVDQVVLDLQSDVYFSNLEDVSEAEIVESELTNENIFVESDDSETQNHQEELFEPLETELETPESSPEEDALSVTVEPESAPELIVVEYDPSTELVVTEILDNLLGCVSVMANTTEGASVSDIETETFAPDFSNDAEDLCKNKTEDIIPELVNETETVNETEMTEEEIMGAETSGEDDWDSWMAVENSLGIDMPEIDYEEPYSPSQITAVFSPNTTMEEFPITCDSPPPSLLAELQNDFEDFQPVLPMLEDADMVATTSGEREPPMKDSDKAMDFQDDSAPELSHSGRQSIDSAVRCLVDMLVEHSCVTSEGSLTCLRCSASVEAHSDNLKEHALRHIDSNLSLFSCKLCSFESSSATGIQGHIHLCETDHTWYKTDNRQLLDTTIRDMVRDCFQNIST